MPNSVLQTINQTPGAQDRRTDTTPTRGFGSIRMPALAAAASASTAEKTPKPARDSLPVLKQALGLD